MSKGHLTLAERIVDSADDAAIQLRAVNGGLSKGEERDALEEAIGSLGRVRSDAEELEARLQGRLDNVEEALR